MEKGRVKWFNQEKGFGFMERPGQSDLFLHMGDRQVRIFQADASGEPKVLTGGKLFKRAEDRKPRREGGDFVYYEIGMSRDGKLKAAVWEFAETYDQAKYESLVLAGGPKSTMPFEVAAKLLVESDFWSLRDSAFGDEEFGWREGEEEIAGGMYSHLKYTVWVFETMYYVRTDFKDAEAERLYDAGGKTHLSERNDAGDPREW
jgi:hypothetical protein